MSNEEAKNILMQNYREVGLDSLENTIENEEYNNALNKAIEALEKQIPQKPVEGYMFREKFREYLLEKKPDWANAKGSCCPNCGNHIGENEMILKKQNGYPHCKWCGQKINWENEEEC